MDPRAAPGWNRGVAEGAGAVERPMSCARLTPGVPSPQPAGADSAPQGETAQIPPVRAISVPEKPRPALEPAPGAESLPRGNHLARHAFADLKGCAENGAGNANSAPKNRRQSDLIAERGRSSRIDDSPEFDIMKLPMERSAHCGLKKGVCRTAHGGARRLEAVAVSEQPASALTGPNRNTEQLRADMYGLLAVLLARPPDAATLRLVAGISGSNAPLGGVLSTLAAQAAQADAKQVEREFHSLFIGLGRGELMPYGSFYLTGFLHEKPLAKLRTDLAALGITRVKTMREPEDHIACLCETMQALITGTFGESLSLPRQRQFFEAHLSPWAGHFFADLESARNAKFYEPVGTAGRLFLEIEAKAFRMEG